MPIEELIEAIIKGDVQQQDHMSPGFNDLMLACLSKDTNLRLTIGEVLAHPYLEGAEFLKDTWVQDFR